MCLSCLDLRLTCYCLLQGSGEVLLLLSGSEMKCFAHRQAKNGDSELVGSIDRFSIAKLLYSCVVRCWKQLLMVCCFIHSAREAEMCCSALSLNACM